MEPDSHSSRRSAPSWPIVTVMAIVVIWGVADLVRSYPDHFFPRFWDEAVYMTDVLTPGALLADRPDAMTYAPAKLGYGLPLALAVRLLGPEGAMYLSTLLWALIIVTAGITLYRKAGLTTAMIAAGLLTYSPFLGKYVAEAGPTLLAALLFVLLWAVYQRRSSWLTGLIVGLIAAVDFKWATPAGLSIVTAELSLRRGRPWSERLLRIVETGLTAIAILAIIYLIHPPFGAYLKNYITNHAGIVQFAPSAIFGYYLLLFGAGPTTILAGAAILLRPIRHQVLGQDSPRAHLFRTALLFAGVPILFYSLISTLKALRFFAVVFPLFGICVAILIGALADYVRTLLVSRPASVRRLIDGAVALIITLAITIGSDGPARHLRQSAGIQKALQTLSKRGKVDGTVSSYIWPVVHYGWRYPFGIPPFAMWGFLPSDRWVLLDDVMDRVTIESRLLLQPTEGITADSLWTVHEEFRRVFDPVLHADAQFYASDYFLCESAVLGIPTLRRWRDWCPPEGNRITVYRVDLTRLGKLNGNSSTPSRLP